MKERQQSHPTCCFADVGLQPDDAKACTDELRREPGARAGPSTRATRADLSRAFTALETAVRRDPGQRPVADEPGQGFRHPHRPLRRTPVNISGSSASGWPRRPPSSADDAVLAVPAVEVLRARAFAGGGSELQLKLPRWPASLIGFRSEDQGLRSQRPLAGSTEAYVVLAAILEDRLARIPMPRPCPRATRESERQPGHGWRWPAGIGSAATWQPRRRRQRRRRRSTPTAPKPCPSWTTSSPWRRRTFDQGLEGDRPATGEHPDGRMHRAGAVLASAARRARQGVGNVAGRGWNGSPGQPGLLLVLADVLLQAKRDPGGRGDDPGAGRRVRDEQSARGPARSPRASSAASGCRRRRNSSRSARSFAGSEEQTRMVDLLSGPVLRTARAV